MRPETGSNGFFCVQARNLQGHAVSPKQITEATGINPIKGGRAAVVVGQIVQSETYESKTAGLQANVSISYFGGSVDFRLPTDHPVAKVPVGDEVAVSYQWTEKQYGKTVITNIHDVKLIPTAKAG